MENRGGIRLERVIYRERAFRNNECIQIGQPKIQREISR
jgi:hypothetical protein